MKHKQRTGELSTQNEASKEKWYGYYTEKTIPERLKKNARISDRAEVNRFFHEHKHTDVLFLSNKTSERISQYYCKICGFTFGLCSLHAIRLHCFMEHKSPRILKREIQEELK